VFFIKSGELRRQEQADAQELFLIEMDQVVLWKGLIP
jgi:hypothetical protein